MTIDDTMRRLADEAPDADRRAFARLVVAELRLALLGSGALPTEMLVPMHFADGTAMEIPVRPLIGDGGTVVRLADALAAVGRDDPSFDVQAADLVDAAQDVEGVGLVLFVNDLPAMAVGVVADGTACFVRTEGFERAIVGMAGELPRLFERVRRSLWNVASTAVARIRREKVPAKATPTDPEKVVPRRRSRKRLLRGETGSRSLKLTLPAMTLRRAARPIVVGRQGDGGAAVLATPSAVPLLIPIRGLKTDGGAYPPRAPLERLRHALGVQAVLTDHSLRQLLGTTAAAEMAIRNVTGDNIGHLRRIGREHLVSRTGFDAEAEVVAWAAAKYRHLPAGNRSTAAVRQMRDQELAAVDVLTRAYTHAMRIVAAYDEAEALEVAQIAPRLEAAFSERNNRTDMPVGDLFQVAVFADINPIVFWPQHIAGFAAIFEAGRFMGRLQAGVAAEVNEVVADLLIAPHDAAGPIDAPARLVAVVWQTIDVIYGRDLFVGMLRRARRQDGTLAVERGTRQLRITGQTGTRREAS